ncbi:hypothetical protein [Desulfovibrio gilichinskyi]|uniref:Phosphotransferase enzyme family protein n=1 Tax=Desulfovibrio gilichinskyi TaxID=1519643 RepID=A0A1X7EAH8_9BACT|nr:hypothetical protein [Desulfovibrio gilichinskyi]SMF30354.1 hypothetical protein SAMN06295933_2829 [Desulfovibrio gilichinskyi]
MGQSKAKLFVFNALGKETLSSQRICAGKNSKVYRVNCKSGESYAVKFYMQPTADGRSRLKQEWDALSFLRQSGVANVPRCIEFGGEEQAAIYSFIHGSSVRLRTNADITSVLKFLRQLKSCSIHNKARLISRAAEACFSLTEIFDNLNRRFNRLSNLPHSDDLFVKMHGFLEGDFSKVFKESVDFAKKNVPENSWDLPLPLELRFLSPSDFGFHNSIRSLQGDLFFLDFEYFGWDDPVKATSDFLLHPAMELSDFEIASFYKGMFDIFSDDQNFETRFKIFLPLYRLKWCLILLNEFFNEALARRKFASDSAVSDYDLRRVQLDKAKKFLNSDKKIMKLIFDS